MSNHPEPIAVNRVDKLVFYDDNVVRPFVNMLDGDGDETDDPMQALAVVVMINENCWQCIDLRNFTRNRVLH